MKRTEERDRQDVEMDDGVWLRTRTSGDSSAGAPPVVMVHGSPGLPDYLDPVAEMITDLCRVHHYDQRAQVGRPGRARTPSPVTSATSGPG